MESSTSVAPNAASATGGGSSTTASSEDDLRRELRLEMQHLNRREPLDANYKKLLMSRTLTNRLPVLPKDKFYKPIESKLRERVEVYMQEMQGKGIFDRISQRKPLEEDSMRSAFTLREAKEHEQIPLLEATLISPAQFTDPERKRYLDGIALGLQKKIRTTRGPSVASGISPKEHAEQARRRAELEQQQAQARQWEDARRKREEEERIRQQEELAAEKRAKAESPQQALHKIIDPVFQKLWDMEFPNLGGTNPFRIVIDRETCARIGAPDYFDVISIPMNLTYIQTKVQNMQYLTLQSFFADVDLMLANAVKYNSNEGNPYRLAAEEMKRRHDKIVKRVYQQIQQRQHAQKP